jgi:predicted transcriptional regulator of viral defense system
VTAPEVLGKEPTLRSVNLSYETACALKKLGARGVVIFTAKEYLAHEKRHDLILQTLGELEQMGAVALVGRGQYVVKVPGLVAKICKG